MINFNAYVFEIEPKKRYRVFIEDVCGITILESGYQSALASVIESMLSYDYDYVEVDRGMTRTGKGYRYRKYDVSVDNGDDF